MVASADTDAAVGVGASGAGVEADVEADAEADADANDDANVKKELSSRHSSMAFGEEEKQVEREVGATDEDTNANVQPHVDGPVKAAALENHM